MRLQISEMIGFKRELLKDAWISLIFIHSPSFSYFSSNNLYLFNFSFNKQQDIYNLFEGI